MGGDVMPLKNLAGIIVGRSLSSCVYYVRIGFHLVYISSSQDIRLRYF